MKRQQNGFARIKNYADSLQRPWLAGRAIACTWTRSTTAALPLFHDSMPTLPKGTGLGQVRTRCGCPGTWRLRAPLKVPSLMETTLPAGTGSRAENSKSSIVKTGTEFTTAREKGRPLVSLPCRTTALSSLSDSGTTKSTSKTRYAGVWLDLKVNGTRAMSELKAADWRTDTQFPPRGEGTRSLAHLLHSALPSASSTVHSWQLWSPHTGLTGSSG
mmetsp:Transcript_6067/g.9411  ORF Transcript_6067/g.9411 Transcript_6067/m.9411 type:complete len:216 (+) Transcript_6067:293-940(+)